MQTELALDIAVTQGSLDAVCFEKVFRADPRKHKRIKAVQNAQQRIQAALKVDLGEALLTAPPPEKKKASKSKIYKPAPPKPHSTK